MTLTLSVAENHERAQRYFAARDYITAAQYLGEVVDAAPDDVAARLMLARAYYHSAQLTRAEATLREVIALDPSEAYAYLMLGRVLQRLSRHDEAIRLYQETLAARKRTLPPDHPDTLLILHNIAISYSGLDRHHEALKLQQQTLAAQNAPLIERGRLVGALS